MTYAKTDDRHIVAVILGGRSGASRDQAMASLVRSNLPRAYAGLRQAPAVAEAPVFPFARPTVVADAEAATVPVQRPAPAPARRPLDLANLRPVVASAAGAGTATPSQPLRLQPNGLFLPPSAQAFAPTPVAEAAGFVPVPRADERSQVARLDAPDVRARAGPLFIHRLDDPAWRRRR